MNDLCVTSFPLRGSQLIEASAGAGKTWTIAMLYVRLVLGPHPGADTALPPLLPPQIRVVTFTDAATQELKLRIGQRLAQAAHVFAADASCTTWPPELQALADLRALYPPHTWPHLARRLRLAADGMDEAAISTLHGWALRTLREAAFASGMPFTLELLTDTRALQEQAIDDLWRVHYAGLPPALAASVAAVWPHADALAQALTPVLRHAERWAAQWPGLAGQTLPQVLQQAEQARQTALAPWKARARTSAEAALAVLDQHGAPKALGKSADVRRWLQTLRDWADTDDHRPPDLKTGAQRFTADFRDRTPDLPAAWRALDLWDTVPALGQALAHLPSPHGWLLRHAAVWVQQRLDALLAERDATDYDGLLRRLADALDAPGGAELAQRLRTQQPVALVDEFQDTDPVQLRILDRIYGLHGTDADRALILIGDPKQAIYAFRQADIHSYLQARRACAGRLWRLGTNWRSSDAMVQAVNTLFGLAEARQPMGAFRFRHHADNPVPFEPARAQGRSERWQAGRHAAPLPALTLAHVLPTDGACWNQERLRAAVAAACAQTLTRWLTEADADRRGFYDPAHDQWQPLRPGDITVLVNTRDEAAAVQAALDACGVASVYLSERESVYASDEAATLQRWLHACVHPRDTGAVRAALADPCLNLSPGELHAWVHDEVRWETTLERFERYHRWLHERGVLPVVRALLHDFDVAHRLLDTSGAAHDGHRRLTNLLHLAELLQQAAARLSGPQALLRYLHRARAVATDAPPSTDELSNPLLRLDDERERVRVVTVHKSKGLEYPVVFYPFAMVARVIDSKNGKDPTTLLWHDENGAAHVTLNDEGPQWWTALARADEERLAEELRRFYVAVTRARHALWLGTAATDRLGRSALGYLLGLPDTADDAALQAALQALAARRPRDIVVDTMADGETTLRWRPPTGAARAATGSACYAPRREQTRWWTASYSALLAEPDAPAAAAAGVAPVPADDPEEAPTDAWLAEWRATDGGRDQAAPAPLGLGADGAPAAAWHAWPAGAAAGSALHAALQHCAHHGFAPRQGPALADVAAAALRASGEPWANDAQRAATLAAWMQAIITTPLPWPGAAPAALHAVGRTQAEMEFWLGVATVPARRIDALLHEAVPLKAPRAPVRDVSLNGLLKGYIDLVVEHEGRYYVLDHKSNRLGADDDAYAPAALDAAVAAHRYDLQAVLYLLALHRLLRQRLIAYDPARHLGGALVVFWRGLGHASRGAWALPAPVALIERLDALLAPMEAAA
ncbi:exodeoxyribonuclease V subunit beta [Tepidimonas charontis]|uniref:RecBCD enzyme subunit RecB n=1 Tax=Tepidimonas charontis TaxID=2267262 RepID=A0A554XFE8_9BURK|nr:exodeoxyribonuclease V subunit beta [Tepidimonas charontis]TSE34550.1 RecBCD enzyme subunit RecB [Tepidimonas charontis]